jgi:hypothetical protein
MTLAALARSGKPQISKTDEPTRSRVGITAVAYSLPEREVTTADLQDRIAVASGLPLPAGMFAQATGIDRRRVAADGEYASDLAIGAAWTRSTSTCCSSPPPRGTWWSRPPPTWSRPPWAAGRTRWT